MKGGGARRSLNPKAIDTIPVTTAEAFKQGQFQRFCYLLSYSTRVAGGTSTVFMPSLGFLQSSLRDHATEIRIAR